VSVNARIDHRVGVLVGQKISRKDAKVEGKTGLAATDVAKAMSVKKDGKESKKECIQ